MLQVLNVIVGQKLLPNGGAFFKTDGRPYKMALNVCNEKKGLFSLVNFTWENFVQEK